MFHSTIPFCWYTSLEWPIKWSYIIIGTFDTLSISWGYPEFCYKIMFPVFFLKNKSFPLTQALKFKKKKKNQEKSCRISFHIRFDYLFSWLLPDMSQIKVIQSCLVFMSTRKHVRISSSCNFSGGYKTFNVIHHTNQTTFNLHKFTWWLIQTLNVVIKISSVIKNIDKINSVYKCM